MSGVPRLTGSKDKNLVSKTRKTLVSVGIVLALLIGVVVVLVIFSPCLISVTVRNDSEQTITAVSVTVQGRKLDFEDIAPGRSERRWFRNIGGDDHYTFAAKRSDGTSIQASGGYITGGYFCGWAQFTIASSGDVAFAENYY